MPLNDTPPPLVAPGRQATRAPVFFWTTIGLLALLLLGGIAAAVWLAFEAKSINRSGGWGWLLAGAVYMLAIIAICFACVLCTVVSLFRREAHRPWSIAILIISGLVVLASAPSLVGAVNSMRQQHEQATSKKASRPPADSVSPATNAPP